MRDHLALLRTFYRGYRAHKRWLHVQDRPPWDSEMVIEWARILRIPPFEAGLPGARQRRALPDLQGEQGSARGLGRAYGVGGRLAHAMPPVRRVLAAAVGPVSD